ncbi:MAG: anaerobic ribonucleoside-triphosphate reductase activating protein [Candidatus Aphodosoma sp.]
MTLSVLDIVESTTVDGPGFRTAIYAAGCSHHCPGCHNPQSWNIKAGHPVTIEYIANRLLNNPFENVTFTGGDPLYQAEEFAELAQLIKLHSTKTIWCYTGYTFETIRSNPKFAALLKNIDVLVDGRFLIEKRNTDLLFRGSENQRLIDVQRSINSGEIIEYQPKTKPLALMSL